MAMSMMLDQPASSSHNLHHAETWQLSHMWRGLTNSEQNAEQKSATTVQLMWPQLQLMCATATGQGFITHAFKAVVTTPMTELHPSRSPSASAPPPALLSSEDLNELAQRDDWQANSCMGSRGRLKIWAVIEVDKAARPALTRYAASVAKCKQVHPGLPLEHVASDTLRHGMHKGCDAGTCTVQECPFWPADPACCVCFHAEQAIISRVVRSAEGWPPPA